MTPRRVQAAALLLVAVVLGAVALFAFGRDGSDARTPQRTTTATRAADRFDAAAAFALLRRQVEYGPRPAGSAASKRLAAELRGMLPGGRFQNVPGGMRNVIGVVPGRDPSRRVLLAAHYDTFRIPGFVGANDGASGVAVVVQIARRLKPRTIRPTVVFALFDGEEEPPDAPAGSFLRLGVRGSTYASTRLGRLDGMVLLDMIGDRDLSIPRESGSDPGIWRRLRAAARRVGAARHFPSAGTGRVLDDHVPFQRVGVRAVDLIDFSFPCWHTRCDDLSAVSAASLDAVGETVVELLRTW